MNKFINFYHLILTLVGYKNAIRTNSVETLLVYFFNSSHFKTYFYFVFYLILAKNQKKKEKSIAQVFYIFFICSCYVIWSDL